MIRLLWCFAVTLRNLTSKRSLLVISEILWLFINTLTADEKYSLRNRENLLQLIQMILSEKQKSFNQFLAAFLKFTSNIYMKDVVSLMSKHPVLEYPSTVTMSKRDPFSIYKECWNLHENIWLVSWSWGEFIHVIYIWYFYVFIKKFIENQIQQNIINIIIFYMIYMFFNPPDFWLINQNILMS